MEKHHKRLRGELASQLSSNAHGHLTEQTAEEKLSNNKCTNVIKLTAAVWKGTVVSFWGDKAWFLFGGLQAISSETVNSVLLRAREIIFMFRTFSRRFDPK